MKPLLIGGAAIITAAIGYYALSARGSPEEDNKNEQVKQDEKNQSNEATIDAAQPNSSAGDSNKKMAQSQLQPQSVGLQASNNISQENAGSHRQRTFIMVKPDGVQRNLVSKIIFMYEQRGFKLVAMKMCRPTEDHMRVHYDELKNFDFFPNFLKQMTSGPVVAMVWEGDNVIRTGRNLNGATQPKDHQMGTFRANYSIGLPWNCVHGSDSEESARREILHWFRQEEIVEWQAHGNGWVYEVAEEKPQVQVPQQEPPKKKKEPKPLPKEYIMKAVDDRVVADEDKKEEKADGAADAAFLDGFDAFDNDDY